MGNLTKPCLSRQVFQGSRRWTGRKEATVPGLKPSRQCSQPGSLNPGAALESEGRVKLIEHSQASSQETSRKRLCKAPAKTGPAVKIGPSNVARREWRTAGVQSGPNPSREECGTWKSRSYPAWMVSRQANRKAGSGEAAWRGSKKPRPVCNGSDMPTSIWSFLARKSAEPLPMGNANDERHLPLGASQCCPHKVASASRPPTSIAKRCDEDRLRHGDVAFLIKRWAAPDTGGFRKA